MRNKLLVDYIALLCFCVIFLFNDFLETSLVAQWLRIRLPTQGTRIQALVREDPTCRRATKPVHTTTEPAL